MKTGTLSHAVGSAMGARVGMAVLNYGLFWSLSRHLGTTALGGFSLLMNVYFMASMLPLLGLSAPLTRRVATERASVGVEFANAVVFVVPVAVVLMIVVARVGRFAYSPDLALPFDLIALSMLPTAATVVFESTLMGLERVADVARMQFAEAFLRTLFSVGAVYLGHGLVGVFGVFLVLRCVAAVGYRLHPALPHFEWRLVTRALQRRCWREVPIFLGIGLLAIATGRLDIIVLSRLAGLREVGIYAAASRLYEASLMLPTIAALAIMPTLARLYASDRDRFRAVLVVAMRLCLGLGVVVALAVAALADPIIHLLYRPEVGAATPVLRWLIFGAVLMTLDQIVSSTMMAAKAQAHDLGALGLGLSVLVAGLILLAPRFEATGAAIAVVLAIASRVAYRLRWIVRLLDLRHLGRDLGRVFVAALAGIEVLVATLPFGAVVALGSSLVVYVLTLAVIGGIPSGTTAAVLQRVAALRAGRA